MKWLDSVFKQMEGIKRADIRDAENEIRSGEVLIAVIEDESIKKLFTLRQRMGDQILALAQKAMHSAIDEMAQDDGFHDPKTCVGCKLQHEASVLKEQHETLDSLFWTEVKTLLTESQISAAEAKVKGGSNGIGIRKGWQVVAMPPERRSTVFDAISISLEDLLGVTRRH